MTTTTVPEKTAASQALDALPQEWVTEELLVTVLRAASLKAVRRILTERADDARARREMALAQVQTGDLDALDVVVEARLELDAVEAARADLPPAELDPEALHVPLQRAQAAVADAERSLELPVPAFTDDMERWRRAVRETGQPFLPPVATDAERALSARLAGLAKRTERARLGCASWRADVARGGIDPLPMLGAAAGHVAAAGELAPEVAEAVDAVEAANANRATSGRTWRHPGDTAVRR